MSADRLKIGYHDCQWQSTQELPSMEYVCWYCNADISSNKGYQLKAVGFGWSEDPYRDMATLPDVFRSGIYICHRCGFPTFVFNNSQIPGIPYGKTFSYVPKTINTIYDEARDCYGVNAYTATVLLCRKILMHIAVEEGAKENKPFVYYVDYLRDNNLITSTSFGWVDKIRQFGNKANHDLTQNNRSEAETIISFTAMLLTTMYEYPAIEKELK